MKKITLITALFSLLMFSDVFAEFSLLHTFSGQPTGMKNPYGSLIQDGSTLYGMTRNGGATDEGGIFKVQTDGNNFSIIHSFDSTDTSNGSGVQSESLIQDGSTLYGMTQAGGTSGKGTIFKIDTSGSNFQLLHIFESTTSNGAWPEDYATFGMEIRLAS